MFYSKTTGGFYATEIHGDNIPNDAVEISAKDHAALIQKQSEGMRIVADDNGFPIWIAPPPPPPVIPQAVSPRQIRMALTRMGIRQAVEDAVAAGDQDLKDWWEFSTVFERDNEQVTEMAQALNVNEAQLDLIWTLAASL